MIIGVDVREGVREKRAGKGEYVRELVPRLIRDSQDKFVLFADRHLPSDWRLDGQVRCVVFHLPPMLWQVAVLLYLEFIRPVDVYFSTTSLVVPALARSVPTVTTLFDFVSFLFPADHQRRATILERIWMVPALRYASRLLAISGATKDDAVRLFGVPSTKITVTHLASSLIATESAAWPLGPNAILFIGTLEPRKNLVRLINAFEKLRDEGITATLVLAGQWGWNSGAIQAALESSPCRDEIKILGYIAPEQKGMLLRGATVLAFPSLYEGFGLPPLEAMSVGVPVIASRTSSLSEVVGRAAITIDPNSTAEIYEAIKKVLTDERLRHQLIEQGRARAQRFSWEQTAQLTLSALHQSAARRVRSKGGR